jgi:hypothetical protein
MTQLVTQCYQYMCKLGASYTVLPTQVSTRISLHSATNTSVHSDLLTQCYQHKCLLGSSYTVLPTQLSTRSFVHSATNTGFCSVSGDSSVVGWWIAWCFVAGIYSSLDGYTLVTLPRTVTPNRDGVDGTRDHVTYQKLVML